MTVSPAAAPDIILDEAAWSELLEVYGAAAFRTPRHCPMCLLRQDTGECTCRDLELSAMAVFVADVEGPPPADRPPDDMESRPDLPLVPRKDLE